MSACGCGTAGCADCGEAVPVAAVADPQHFRHDALRDRMLGRIAGARDPQSDAVGARPLGTLTTRSLDDPAIALVDAFAGSLHVLAWNTARLFDDGTIARTEDRDALIDLVRLIGYAPRPAISAETVLSFTLETLPGAPEEAQVARGTKVASMPGQGELPRTFETSADLVARGEWNAMPAVSPVEKITTASRTVYALGVATAARIGDALLAPVTDTYAPIPMWIVARIGAVARISDPAVTSTPHTRFDLVDVQYRVGGPGYTPARLGRIFVLGRQAAPFGAQAPDVRLLDEKIRANFAEPGTVTPGQPQEWKGFEIGAPGATESPTADLDGVYPEAITDRLVLFTPTDAAPAETGTIKRQFGVVTKAVERARTDFGLSAKVSRITVDSINLGAKWTDGTIPPGSMRYAVRETSVAIETESLVAWLPPQDVALPGTADRLTIVGATAPPVGRTVILSGEMWMGSGGVSGPPLAEAAIILEATAVTGGFDLRFERPVTGRFRSTTLRVLGNSVRASHGETPSGMPELIGSGQPSRAGQRFALSSGPLAYVPAATPRGYAPAVDLRIGERLYVQCDDLSGLAADDHAYSVRQVRGKTEIQVAGRLPAGTLNVAATYRVGGGKDGNLVAGKLGMMMSPVLGVTRVTNTLPSEGGSDAETLEEARRTAPLSLRALDRIVSIADYASFTAAYRGIGKVLATELRSGLRSTVCVTIATTEMEPPAAGSPLIEALRKEIARVAAPGRSVRIEGFDALRAILTVALAIDEGTFRRASVEAAVRAALAAAFGPARRGFGQPLHRSEILAVVQSVEGVIAAALPGFARSPAGPPELDGRLFSQAPALSGGSFTRAGLLAVAAGDVSFLEMIP